MLEPSSTPWLLCSLERATRQHPATPRVLVVPVQQIGLDLLEGLERRGVPAERWSVITPRALATSMIRDRLDENEVRAADDLDETALVDDVLDAYVREHPSAVAAALDGPGFRRVVLRAVRALRIAGVDSTALAGAPLNDLAKRELLVGVLGAYERGLAERGLADPAELFRRAVQALAEGERPFGRVYIAPGLYRGLTGSFLRALQRDGAELLATDSVVGIPAPEESLWDAGAAASPRSFLHAPDRCPAPDPAMELFSGASRIDELREVLRRVLEVGASWQDVEIVAADPSYAVLLDGLGRRLGIPVCHGLGLPIGRTRLGRALGLFLDWVELGFRVEHLRPLLQGGDLTGDDAEVDGVRLARRLAALGIRRGRDRYLPRIDAALARETEDEIRSELLALRVIIEDLLEAVPVGGNATPASVAGAVTRVLDLLDAPRSEGVREALAHRLERISATLGRQMPLSAAAATVRGRLELYVSEDAEEDGPGLERSDVPVAGLLITSLRHGGRSGRSHVFVVGLSADAFPGAGIQDPLLTDEDRRALVGLHPAAASGLPNVAEGLAERKFALAAMLAGIRDSLTLSFPGWNPTEARPVGPAAILLQALRVKTGDAAADYDRLREAVGALHGAVPSGSSRLDRQDEWLGLLRQDGIFLDGTARVRAAHPGLDQGLRGWEARFGPELTAYHGVIEPRPDVLDPRRNSRIVVSASRLETLGRCPHLYLLKYVLRAQVPDTGPAVPDAWLDPRARGTLLHHVFEQTLRMARELGIDPGDERLPELGLELLDRAAAELREELLPPGELVFRRECQDLRRDVRAWAASLRDDPAEWIDFELAFGAPGDPHPPVPIELGGGTIHARGAIDRVDRLADGRLRIVDYKTGSPAKYSRKSGVFDGGRRIQHFLYSEAASVTLGQAVARMEYVFPTKGGLNGRAAYDHEAIAGGRDLLDTLLDLVAHGHLVHTEDPADCRYCDYRSVCRVEGEGHAAVSPLAEWAGARAPELPAYAPLLNARSSS